MGKKITSSEVGKYILECMSNPFTYEMIADAVGLLGTNKLRYLLYMNKRWANDEKLNCKCGYAKEWADRFRSGVEWSVSDREGQRVLVDISNELKL